ncbi:MAG TPA: SPFH domain-containing protein [Candidatus Didemnitutus sp.]|nr:SPFH domain-containing protein [Candidatus Didemnitutus sp.]
MTIILLFSVLGVVALALSFLLDLPRAGRVALVVLAVSLLVFGLGVGSSVVVGNDETGIVAKQFGDPLPTGQIIARHGERGPQQDILGPGWHFGYIPFVYQVHLDPIITIEPGQVGVVAARDGLPLPDGQTFAPAWANAQDMLNAPKFLAGGGYRGPQTTILTPGTYRYNTALHQIRSLPALQVAAGTVAVIKSNTGKVWPMTAEHSLPVVNGVPLVGREYRGIWAEALTPGAYYLNTEAFVPTMVKTTQRTYTYQAFISQPAVRAATLKPGTGEDWSVTVRSKDGFSFPIDVRVSCAVEAANAPYLVALLGNPDQLVKDEQEGEELEVLEARVVLPVVRAVFRNVAETLTALEFVNSRSEIEQVAAGKVTKELAKFKLTCDGVYVGNIHLDVTEQGRKLLATQTDREVAVNQEKLFGQQKLAEEARAKLVRATEEAEQQRNLAAAEYRVRIEGENAHAQVARSKGEAESQVITGEGRAKAYKMLVETLGQNQVAQLELLKLVADGKVQITPQVMVSAGGAGTMDALAGTLLRQAVQTSNTPAAK